jgi:hypothetical protein
MYVSVDKKTGQLVLDLPAGLSGHKTALEKDLMDEFAFESLNQPVILRMNEYVRSWCEGKGLKLPPLEGAS